MRLDAQQFANVLRDVLDPVVIQRILTKKDDAGLIGGDALAAEGIDARVDAQSLTLNLRIEPEVRRLTTVPLRGAAPTPGPGAISLPASVSSYLNVRTGLDYDYRTTADGSKGRQPINVALENGTNILGGVFEGTMNYAESGRRHWQRGDFRLLKDDSENMLRYTVGDLSYPVDGFQSFQAVGGISIARNFSLQPYQIVQPTGQQEILLRSDSRVDVFVNGRRSDTLRLPAGRYNLRDFPFTQGANDAELQITDNVGRVTNVDIPFFFSSALLAPGLSQYSYALGVPSRDEDGLRRYATTGPVFSGLH
jgi:outer membrane usher protein